MSAGVNKFIESDFYECELYHNYKFIILNNLKKKIPKLILINCVGHEKVFSCDSMRQKGGREKHKT